MAGCKRKKIEKERLCTRVDLEKIISLLPKTVEDVERMGADSKYLMDEMIKTVGNVKPDERNFANTVRAYDSAKFQFIMNKQILAVIGLLSSDHSLQLAANAQLIQLEQYETEVLQRNLTIYQAFKDYQDLGNDTQRRSTAGRQFLRQMLQKFEHEGVTLPIAQQSEIAALEKDIMHLEGRYNGNIAYDARSLVVTIHDLYGLPQDFIQTLHRNEQGDYILPLNFKTFFMVTENCLVEHTRREFYRAFGQRAYPQNVSILQSLLQKRHQLAEHLDFPHYAAYQLHTQMIKNPKRAEHFLWGVIHELQKYDEKDFTELTKSLPPSVQLTKDGKIKAHDEALLKSWYRKQHFSLNDYEIAQYFPLEHTLEQLLHLFKKFFHIEFVKQEIEPDQLWAPDVLCYQVRSLTNQVILGYLFLDLYSAAYKKTQEPCNVMLLPTIKDDCSIPCAGASVMIASFARPRDDKPALLELSEVKTLFHELGHSLHVLFGSTCFVDFAGTQVVKDFVEVPSQMLEHWLEDEHVIQSISQHWQTGEKLSKDKIQQVLQAQRFGLAGRMLKQAYLALVALHMSMYGHTKDVHKMIEKLHKKIFKHIQYDPHHYLEYNFSHLAHYAATYYTYLWSRVIAADFFEHIKQKGGIMNHEVGKEYTRDILTPGGFVPPHAMIKKFLKRPFNTKAFMSQFNQ